MLTVIIPAHNEARVIGRLLDGLLLEASPDELDVIVAANGCVDNTEAVAVARGPRVRVISIPTPSKQAALRAGDEVAHGFPRIYVDADVELGTQALRALADALRQPGVLAVGPMRVLALTDRPWPVRWYYDVWSRLPSVRDGLFGRGVIGVNAEGHARIEALPELMSDDLAWSLAFGSHERAVVTEARAIVHTPRTVPDLLRRRSRAATGVRQLEGTVDAPRSSARTQPSHLLALVRREPLMLPRVLVFIVLTIAARWHSKRAERTGNYSTWLRDESSRR